MLLKRRALLVVLAVISVAIPVTALIYAPYLPRLMSEGYPAMTWPAAGSFVPVRGATEPASPISIEMKSSKLHPAGRRLFEERQGKALLIYQGGKLRLEHYAEGFQSDTKVNSYSMVKSLVGALVLRAHADGRIQSLRDPVGRYLTELGDTEFRAIPILAFLQMRSGVVYEPDGVKSALGGDSKDIEATRLNPIGPMPRLHMRGLDAVSGKLRVRRGQQGRYSYQNINTAILGRLISKVYDKPLEDILSEKIWVPAGAQDAFWRQYGPGGPVSPYCCLYATPRDWLRVGIFLVNNGTKDGAFLPRYLWRRFLGHDLSYDAIRSGHYGLHIYQNVLDRAGEPLQGPFTYMMGSGGQIVYLMPNQDLVAVRFGEQIQLLHSTLYTGWRSISE
jgi:CubicO group peptidase (beta-lactamase class C family)